MEYFDSILGSIKEMNADELRGIIEGFMAAYGMFQSIGETNMEAFAGLLESLDANKPRSHVYRNYSSVYDSRSKQDA